MTFYSSDSFSPSPWDLCLSGASGPSIETSPSFFLFRWTLTSAYCPLINNWQTGNNAFLTESCPILISPFYRYRRFLHIFFYHSSSSWPPRDSDALPSRKANALRSPVALSLDFYPEAATSPPPAQSFAIDLRSHFSPLLNRIKRDVKIS